MRQRKLQQRAIKVSTSTALAREQPNCSRASSGIDVLKYSPKGCICTCRFVCQGRG